MKKHLTLCPFCGYKHDAVTPTPGNKRRQPVSGDLTLCINCGEFSFFAMVPGGLRKPTDDEYLVFGMEPEIKLVREAWVAVTKGKPS